MKKIISVLLVLFTALTLLAGCGKKEKSQAVLDLEAQIEAISDEITPETGEALSAARAAYDALPEEQQPQMKQLKRLEKLEAEYQTFSDVKKFISDINSVNSGAFDKTTMLSDLIDHAEEMKKNYNNLPEDQKAQLGTLEGLDDAIPTAQTYVDNAKTGAANYVSAFLKLNENKNYTVTAVYCSKQKGNDGEELHFYALTYKNEKGEERTIYSNARFSHEVSASILLTRPETFFSETAPAGDNDPVEYGNVKLDAAEITAAAKSLPAPQAPASTATAKTTEKASDAPAAEETAGATTEEVSDAATETTAAQAD